MTGRRRRAHLSARPCGIAGANGEFDWLTGPDDGVLGIRVGVDSALQIGRLDA
jgi:hypothetical protein